MLDFLTGAGASNVRRVATQDWVFADLTLEQAETAFATRLHRWTNTETGQEVMRTMSQDAPALPSALQGAVHSVFGLHNLPVRVKRKVPTATSLPAQPANASAVPVDVSGAGVTPPPVDPSMPSASLAIVALGDGVGYVYFGPPSTQQGIHAVWLRVSTDGGPPAYHTFPLSSVGVAGNLFVLMVTGLPAFHRYDVAISYSVSTSTSTSTAPADHIAPWGSLALTPEGKEAIAPGVAATPEVDAKYLYSFYGIPPAPAHSSGWSQAVAEFSDQFYSSTDLSAFWSQQSIDFTGTVSVEGPNTPSQPGLESSMDIQWLTAVSPNVDTVFWSVPVQQNGLSGSFVLEWAVEMNNATSPPAVTSISYGLPEDELALAGLGAQYIQRFNAEAAKLCARGLTVVVCSQDAGATDKGHGANNCELNPVFPATSPYVTAVGSTLASAHAPRRSLDKVNSGEALVSLPDGCFWTAGGGISASIDQPRPAWQDAAVASYLSSGAGMPPAGTWNKGLRAYPDISALGRNYPVMLGGSEVMFGDGTSVSTPVISGMLARLNSARQAAGKPLIGFANPLLYKLAAESPSVFYDVVVGENSCGTFTCCPHGWSTAKGYDFASGIGTVADVEAFVQAGVAL